MAWSRHGKTQELFDKFKAGHSIRTHTTLKQYSRNSIPPFPYVFHLFCSSATLPTLVRHQRRSRPPHGAPSVRQAARGSPAPWPWIWGWRLPRRRPHHQRRKRQKLWLQRLIGPAQRGIQIKRNEKGQTTKRDKNGAKTWCGFSQKNVGNRRFLLKKRR